MIRPAALYNKGRYSRDFTSLGRIVAVACGNLRISREDLTDDELTHLEELENESDEMDKQVEEQKARWAERQRNKRARDKEASQNVTDVTQCHGDILMSRNVTVTSECHGDCHDVTILPTNLPTNQTLSKESVGNTRTRTRGDVPDLKTVVTIATTMMGVPEAFARWWFNEMEARDWTTTQGSRIDLRNWRAQLKAWHNKATPQELAQINSTAIKNKPIEVTPDDWILCAERCEHYRLGYACAAGCKIPPVKCKHPHPPEECPHFKEI
jgi:hypothetical protein